MLRPFQKLAVLAAPKLAGRAASKLAVPALATLALLATSALASSVLASSALASSVLAPSALAGPRDGAAGSEGRVACVMYSVPRAAQNPAPIAPLPLPARASSARAGTAAASVRPAQAPKGDPVARFEIWLGLLRTGRDRISERTIDDVRRAISDLRLAWAVDPARARSITGALLELVGTTLQGYARGVEEPEGPVLEARRLAVETLDANLDLELFDWLAREVLPLAHSLPVERRLGAVWTLIPRRIEVTKLALFGCARDPDPRIRAAALEALLGWPDETVHAFFLETLVRRGAEGVERGSDAGLAEQHFAQVVLAPRGRVIAKLAAFVKDGLTRADWRAASRAVALSKPLDNRSVVPFLIEAMSVWKARGAAGVQSLRVQFEILRALELRSGRSLGLSPASWLLWWQAVERGDVRGITPETTSGAIPQGTRASFFGLRPTSDRITFVIDRSGSMAQAFGVETVAPGQKARTRWAEATEQLLAFVELLGEKARFNIVLFHDHGDPWRTKLVPATEANRRAAREWLDQNPRGGTNLRAGVERALALKPDGSADLAALECDTVIILCDGATNDGPAWVEPFLARVNTIARVSFHAVQIGVAGDGTLEKLARGSGGEFVRVDR